VLDQSSRLAANGFIVTQVPFCVSGLRFWESDRLDLSQEPTLVYPGDYTYKPFATLASWGGCMNQRLQAIGDAATHLEQAPVGAA
jgi:hypothetical protein